MHCQAAPSTFVVTLVPVAESAEVNVTDSRVSSTWFVVQPATLRAVKLPELSALNMPKSCGVLEPGARVAVTLTRAAAGHPLPLNVKRAPCGERSA